MSERVPVQSEHRLVRLSLQLEPLGIDVTRLEIDLAIVKLEDRDIAVSIDGNIVRMRWHERIHHYPVEAAIYLLWDLSENDLQKLLAFDEQCAELR